MILNQNLYYNTSSKKQFKRQKFFKNLKFIQVNNSALNLLAANLVWTDMRLLIVFIHPAECEYLNIHVSLCLILDVDPTLREVLGKV